MLDARDAFLGAGWYRPLREALSAHVAAVEPRKVLDVGCGTGYYLTGVLDAVPGACALALDISPAAVGRTVRRGGETRSPVDGLVADVWSPLPIADAAADLILNVFAPRNAAEFARVLRTDGVLVVVIPQPSHLRELRAAGLALGLQNDKAAHLIDGLAVHFRMESRQELSFQMSLTASEIAALVGMGPSAHHHEAGADSPAPGARQSVTAAFEIVSFRKVTVPTQQ
ncbi:methyltransferase domain-containing protein [Glaciibacter psychrotolerans]|uniref:23S rRNA (Guanine745-N1)-methyltransferase n=1 Tax=Glaciibacter psychrotolerans TaxID=670054 RepID=A0A7Z0J5L9_9MICO|nr:methyltransferase domain-containing protein [Leifsonia psychrotolerans]NYJ19281.1 23S rRNA (guanine745-N1)-methyltransferase [Leifsonia psychrotolerans]